MKTTLKQIIENIDLNSKGYKDTYVDVSTIASTLFEIYDVHNDPAERMSAYYIAVWYCTDTYVGLIAYFLDGKFVMCSSQTARKSSIEYEFPDKESYYEVKKYIESLRVEEDEPVIPIIDMNAETKSTFKIHYADQIMYKTALFFGNEVEIIERNTDKEITGTKVKIKHTNGNTEIVDCRSLDFKVLTDFR